MLTGLFLGAGASYELGMPLVWGLTEELKSWLTPEKLRELNNGWRARGNGHPSEVIDALIVVLERSDLHYENILGYLEVLSRRPGSKYRQHYHHIYSWLIEMIYHILYIRHVDNVEYISTGLAYFEGLSRLAKDNLPLWIFSLNHDIIIEMLSSEFGIAIKSGLYDRGMSIPRRDITGAKVGELRVEVITGDELDRLGINYFQIGQHGINIFKLHGALDIFAFNDGKDLLKLLPSGAGIRGVLDSLCFANTQLRDSVPVKVTNEMVYADDAGETQFLRRSLLSGATKFSETVAQVLPMRLLDYFRSNLNQISTLACIGYGFGDLHVNSVIRSWLEFSNSRRIEIISPHVNDVPPCLLHLAPQVKLIRNAASDYFGQFSSRPLSAAERALKDLREKRRVKQA